MIYGGNPFLNCGKIFTMSEEITDKNRATGNSFDIFEWANRAAQHKNDFDVEFFVVNKKYTVFSLPVANELKPQISPVFLLDILGEIEKGAGLGLETREFEKSETEPGVLLYSTRKKVANAEYILNQIETNRSAIEVFNEYDHEFKTIKMIVAKFSRKAATPGDYFAPFYVAKQVVGSGALTERTAWEIGQDGKLREFEPQSAFKIPTDSQVLIVRRHFLDNQPALAQDETVDGSDLIFAFAPKKFAAMFGYNYKTQAIADKKVEEISNKYRLNFPEGQDLNSLVAGRNATIAKLQNLEIGTKTQEELVDYADQMALDLMTADDGAIIIMDGHDVDTFVGLLDDDYLTSDLTGLKYQVKAKKLLTNGE